MTTDKPKQQVLSEDVHVQGIPMKKSPPSPAKSVTKYTKTKKKSRVLIVAREKTLHITPQKKMVQCTVCGKLYETNAGLYKHRRAKHPHMVNSTKSIQCKESNCYFTCKFLHQLRCHLENKHGMLMETTVMDFKDIKGMYIQ